MCHRVAEHSETNRRGNIARDLCPILKIGECVAVGSLHVLRWAKLRILRSRPSANALFQGARSSRVLAKPSRVRGLFCGAPPSVSYRIQTSSFRRDAETRSPGRPLPQSTAAAKVVESCLAL